MAKENDVRIVRADNYNLVVEKLLPVGDAPSGKESINKGKLVWRTMGYYGENLKAAAIGALRHGFSPSEEKTVLEALKSAETNVLKAIEAIKANPAILTEAITENQHDGDEPTKKAGRGRKKKGA